MTVDPSAVTEAGAAGPASTELVPGASVGKYRLDRVLGAGGMGVVWAAFDPDLERPVAIKVLRSLDSVDTLRTRLLREARAMARLKHPNVLTVYEVGTDRNRDYIAMELIDGADLDGWLATKPARPEIVAALVAAGRGLAAAHDAGLIHRDLKPHNILRAIDGRVYVTDFGLARGQIEDGIEVVQAPLAATAIASGAQPRAVDSVLDSPLTQTGMLIGTPAYMAPEQFAGRTPDPRSDQFAFCVTAWEALTGARPFAGKTLEELQRAASAGVGPTPAPGLPPSVQRVLARGLAPVAADRWLDMHVMLQELEAALAPPRPSRVPWIAGGALAVVGFLTGVALYTRSRTAPVAPPVSPVSPTRMPMPPTVPMPPAPPEPMPPTRMPPTPAPTPMPPTRMTQTPPSPPVPARPMPPLLRGGSCGPVSEVFGMAWTAEQRKAIATRHRGEAMLIAVTGLLEETRRDWVRMYETACASPKTAEHQEQLACLLSARDEIAAAMQELATQDGALSVANMMPLAIAVGGCKTDQNSGARGAGHGSGDDDDDER
ncbi:MAG: serine/threonine-protein kinase [Kofleriaceae bacterium]